MHTFTTGINYDWIVRLRADSYILDFPDLEKLSSSIDDRTILCGDKTKRCCGNEDSFGIGPTDLMHWYLKDIFIYKQRTGAVRVSHGGMLKCM